MSELFTLLRLSPSPDKPQQKMETGIKANKKNDNNKLYIIRHIIEKKICWKEYNTDRKNSQL